MNADESKLLRRPFDRQEIGKLPRVTCRDCRQSPKKECGRHTKSKCGECGQWITPAHIHLDYVGHAAVTDRLLSVDPEWTWEPVGFDDSGNPTVVRDSKGQPIGFWIRLTVCGVTRYGFGELPAEKVADGVKEAISDAIRNAAMRFGVALDLWSKEGLGGDHGVGEEPETTGESKRKESARKPEESAADPIVSDEIEVGYRSAEGSGYLSDSQVRELTGGALKAGWTKPEISKSLNDRKYKKVGASILIPAEDREELKALFDGGAGETKETEPSAQEMDYDHENIPF